MKIWVLYYDGEPYNNKTSRKGRKVRVYDTEGMAMGNAKTIAKSTRGIDIDKFKAVPFIQEK